MFSKNKQDYKALSYFEVQMNFETANGKFSETYGFHVPVVQESDGNYYALCLELNQTTNSHTIHKAIERMHDFLGDFVAEILDSSKDWLSIYDEMDEVYFAIFHRLKAKYNKSKAKKLTDFLQSDHNSETKIVTNIEERKTVTITTKLGSVEINKEYEIFTDAA